MFVQSETFRSGSVWISGSSAAGQTNANTSDLHEAAERTKFTSSITFPVLIHNPTEGWGGGGGSNPIYCHPFVSIQGWKDSHPVGSPASCSLTVITFVHWRRTLWNLPTERWIEFFWTQQNPSSLNVGVHGFTTAQISRSEESKLQDLNFCWKIKSSTSDPPVGAFSFIQATFKIRFSMPSPPL